MNSIGKVRFAAAFAIANGSIALGFLSPPLALAATCTPKVVCTVQEACVNPNGAHATCVAHADPGCTVKSAVCSYPNPQGCQPPWYAVTCQYQ